jgi:mono/diheme cytochrome c family protein/MFS family permease
MNYPVWELFTSGGGLLIALIAVLHVYIAHFAVGGGLYLVLCELRANRDNNDDLLNYLKNHARFFMLLTMVLGGVTGVGIWFIMSLLSPEATSVLIHQFVFAWATEWVFFTGEIVALFIYYYTFHRVDRQLHLRFGWIYFIFAWLSLFVVNGIISFMLTPGQWLETGNFWHGFFNPSFWPSLLFRTALTLIFAGIFGLLTAIYIDKETLRNDQIQYCGKWILSGLVSLPIFAHFYYHSLPEQSILLIQGASPEIQPIVILFLAVFAMIIACGGMLFLQLSHQSKKILAYSLLIMGLIYMGSFEWIREASRKPFIIYGYLNANQTYEKNAEQLQKHGILKNAKWTQHSSITSKNSLDAGHDLYLISCSGCHSVGGPMNDILHLTQKYTIAGLEALLTGQGKISTYMPRFYGTNQERNALAKYIVNELNQKTTNISTQPAIKLPSVSSDENIFDQYTLLAWPVKGMHLHADCNDQFTLGKPVGTIQAQLIRRGEVPEHVMGEITIHYNCLAQNISGKMIYDDISMTYVAKNLKISDFNAKTNKYNPYPVITIEARSLHTNECLARTQIVFAVSSAMACKNCHGGKWKDIAQTGVSKATATDILQTHDRINQTSLTNDLSNGKTINCSDCHGSTVKKSNLQTLSLSAAMHGFHANYIDDKSQNACLNCHAVHNKTSLCYRGVHVEMGLTCVDCHGSLTDHALALLVHENNKGKKSAKRYMKHLTSDQVNHMKQIQPRKPWIQEPDCLACHVDYEAPETTIGFNKWTDSADTLFRNQTGDAGIRCIACHGVTHALYPANNSFDADRDNIQALQYQKKAGPIGGNKQCRACHLIHMSDNYHHNNMVQ